MANPLRALMGDKKPEASLPGGLTLDRWLDLTRDGRSKPDGYSAEVREILNHLRGYGTKDTIAALSRYYPTSAARMIAVTLNVVRRIVFEQARVFEGEGQAFDLVNEAGEPDQRYAQAWADLLDACEFERKLRETNRTTRAARRSFVRVTRDDRYGVDLTLFAPDAVRPMFAPDTGNDLDRARGVLLRVADAWDDKGNRIERWEFWSAGLDANGVKVDEARNFILERRESAGLFGLGGGSVTIVEGPSGGLNPYVRDDGTPFVPIVSFSDEDDDAGYWLPPSEQLLTCARAVNALVTDLHHIARKQGHGQPFSTVTSEGGSPEAWPEVVNANPDEPIQVPRGRSLDVLNYNADLAQMSEIVRDFLRQVTQLEGLPPGTVLAEARQAPSGVALEIERAPLIEQRRDQVSVYRRPVHDLMEMVRLVYNSGRPENGKRILGVKPKWTPGDLVAPRDPEAVNRANEQRVRLGLTSPARLLADEHGIGLDEAKVLAAAIAAENGARAKASLADVAAGLRGPPAPPDADDADDAEDEADAE